MNELQVKLDSGVSQTLRQWADLNDRDLNRLINELLRDACMHYQQGRVALAAQRVRELETHDTATVPLAYPPEQIQEVRGAK